MRLPFQALPLVVEQPPERQGRGRALDQRHVTRLGRAAARHDQPSPVLAARAHDGHQPAGRRVVAGPARRRDRAGPRREPGEQPGGVLPGGLARDHLVRQVLQDHRPPGQHRGLPHHLARWRTGHRQVGEHLVQPLRGAQLLELGVDDQRVHRFGDLDELRLPLEHDQRQPVPRRRRNQRSREAAGVPGAELDGQRADPDRRQVGDVAGQPGRVVRQCDAGGQHQLTAAQQVRGLGQLDHVHPAHRCVEAVGGGHHPGRAAAQRIEGEYLGHGRQHGRTPPGTDTALTSSKP